MDKQSCIIGATKSPDRCSISLAKGKPLDAKIGDTVSAEVTGKLTSISHDEHGMNVVIEPTSAKFTAKPKNMKEADDVAWDKFSKSTKKDEEEDSGKEKKQEDDE